MRRIPRRPIKPKWTTKGPCYDHHLIHLGIDSMLSRLLKASSKEFKMRVTSTDTNREVDAMVIQDFQWHEMRSTRFVFYEDGATEATFTVVCTACITIEVLKHFTIRCFRFSSTEYRKRRLHQGRPPPLCDMTWAIYSPAVMVLQYYSMMLAGEGSRTCLSWSRRFSSFDEWQKTTSPDCRGSGRPSKLRLLVNFPLWRQHWWIHAGLKENGLHCGMKLPLSMLTSFVFGLGSHS